MSSLLPIFPLELVLLPGAALPLHIFEPRYKEMITECLAQKKPFGVVRASDEGVADIGCTAEIVSVTKKYDDGRMDILTRGVERFEVLEVNQDRSFWQAEIALLQDENEDEPAHPTAETITQAVRLQAEIAKLTAPSRLDSMSTPPPSRFCWQVRSHSISISSKACSPLCRKPNGCKRSSTIWKPFCPACGGRRKRGGISRAANYCG